MAPLEPSVRPPILEGLDPEPETEADPVEKPMPVTAYFAIAGAIVVGGLWNAIAVFLWDGLSRSPIDEMGRFFLQASCAFMVISYVAAVGIGARRYVPDRSLAMTLYANGLRLYLATLILTLAFFPIGTALAGLAGVFLLCRPTEEYLRVTFYRSGFFWIRDESGRR